MSQRKAKQARRQRAAQPRVTRAGGSRGRRLPLLLAAATAVFAAAVGAGVVIARNHTGPATVAEVPANGTGAVALAGTDPVTGQRVDLASYRNRPVVINIWFSTCPGCNAEAADLAEFDRSHPRTLIGLDTGDTRSGARDFYARYGWRHPSVFDPNGSIAQKFAVTGFPTTVFLDRRHRIVGRIVGASDLRHFEAGLRRAQRA